MMVLLFLACTISKAFCFSSVKPALSPFLHCLELEVLSLTEASEPLMAALAFAGASQPPPPSPSPFHPPLQLPTARMIAFAMALLGCVLIMYKAIWYDQFTCPDGFLLRVRPGELRNRVGGGAVQTFLCGDTAGQSASKGPTGASPWTHGRWAASPPEGSPLRCLPLPW